MRSMVCVPAQRTRDALRRVAFIFAFCVAPFAQAGNNAAPDDVSAKAVDSAVRQAPAPSMRQMLKAATNSTAADDASQGNLRRLLDSATRANAPRVFAALQPAATVSLIASTSSGDQIFADGFDRPCGALGNSCGSASDCCSMTCSANTCINASGSIGCHADSDICSAASDCCSGQCDLTGASGGICKPLSDIVATSCAVEGEPCSASGACCSQLCASVPGGGMACQAPSGCNVTHDLCSVDAACCGGTGGSVHCSTIGGTNPAEGLCSNPTGCKPNGSLCGGASGKDCCSGNADNVNSCGPDLVGVNRCHSLVCVASGQACASSADCCNDLPCVPNSSGTLVCAATSCMPAAAACTTNADCCGGLQCSIAPGALGGTCVN